MRPLWLVLPVAVALIAPARASAQTPPAASSDRARESFELGLAALQGMRVVEAVRYFEESYRLNPFPVVLYNLGLALRGAARTADAVGAFEEYLRAPDADASPEQLATLREEVARMRRALATVRVTVLPPTATVTVDGRAPTRSLDDLLLTPEAHALDASAPGYNPAHVPLSLSAGQSYAQRLQLEPWARLVVRPSVPNATVTVDGRALDASHALSTTPGMHIIVVRAEGYYPTQRAVVTGTTGEMPVPVTLLARPTPPRRPGWVIPTVVGASAVVVGLLTWALVVAATPADHVPSLGTVNL